MKTISKWWLATTLVATFNLYGQQTKLSLEQALAIANEKNKALRIEVLESKALREETKVSRASMLPTVSASGSYAYYFDRQVIFMPGTFTGNDSEPVVDVAVGGKNVFNSYLLLQQPIVAESFRRQVKAARINESIKVFDLKDAQAKLNVDVASSYYQALLMNESIALNKQSLMRNLKSLEDSKLLLLQGKSLKVDTLRNFIVVENLKTTISYLENQHNVIMLQLHQLLGTDGTVSFELTDSLKHDTDARYFAAVEVLYTDAIQNRPDIRSQKLNVELSRSIVSQNVP